MSQTDSITAKVYSPGFQQETKYSPSKADYGYMDSALDQAQEALQAGDSPIGCVLVTPEEVFIAQTTEFRDRDLLAHAEMNVTRLAKAKVGRDLSRSILYTTAEPCVGCSYILDKGHLGQLVIAASREDAPEFFRQRGVNLEDIWADSRRTLTVVRGVRRAQAARLLTSSTKHH